MCILLQNISSGVIARDIAPFRADRSLVLSQNLENSAYIYSQRGETSKAIDRLQQAEAIYQKSGDEEKLVAVLVDLAQSYNSLGQFARAKPILERAISLADKKRDNKALAAAWGVLGNSYSLVKKYDEALSAYRRSFNFAVGIDRNYTVTALNNQVNVLILRGNDYKAQAKIVAEEGETQEEGKLLLLASQDREIASVTANRALEVSFGSNNFSEVKALLNILRVAPQSQYQLRAKGILMTLPDSRNKAYSFIKLAAYQTKETKINSLEQAISISKNLSDFRTLSFAYGQLGHYWEQEGKLNKALHYTRSAVLAAQTVTATDSLYRWQWQLGRINNLAGAKGEAIDSYKQAIASLQSIRSDIASASTDLQFDVRDEVEPVYRQLIGLLLDSGNPKSIREALKTTQLLKLTELQNFFGDECVEVEVNNSWQQNNFSDDKATINTIVLDDKTYVILQANDRVVKYFSIPVKSTDFQNKVKKFRFNLEDAYTNKYATLDRELYNLLIEPMAIDLEKLNPSKLTFINDGILRNIPMAALYDGKQFLVEKYPIDTTLGIELKSPHTAQRVQKVLIFGLTVEIPPFNPLPNVYNEAKNILNLLGGSSYLDKEFTLNSLQNKIQKNNYPIVHIASHSVFSGTTERTFLQAYDRQISLKRFEEMIQKHKSPIELLTLSGCETAAGDNRSVLGLAGVAVRNKVENVLASLWSPNDEDTVLPVEEFYRQLKQPGITRAQALRNTQLSLIASSRPSSHPAVWSTLILISS